MITTTIEERECIRHKLKTNRVEEFYVAAFRVPLGDGKYAEVIATGMNDDGEMTFEPDSNGNRKNAVSSLICLCKQIEEDQGLAWRLLKFDKAGFHELDEGPYLEYLN